MSEPSPLRNPNNPTDPELDLLRRQPHPRLDESAAKEYWRSWACDSAGNFTGDFAKWFRKSRITTDGKFGGTPAVMYHFSRADFGVNPNLPFDLERTEMGMHFGTAVTSLTRSSGYGGAGTGAKTFAAVLSIQRPLYMEDLGNWKMGYSYLKPKLLEAARRERKDVGEPEPTTDEVQKLEAATDVKSTIAALQVMGYDGIIFRNATDDRERRDIIDSVIVFDPIQQVRSAFSGEPILNMDGTWRLD